MKNQKQNIENTKNLNEIVYNLKEVRNSILDELDNKDLSKNRENILNIRLSKIRNYIQGMFDLMDEYSSENK